LVKARIIWSDGDFFETDLSQEAIDFYADLGITIEFETTLTGDEIFLSRIEGTETVQVLTNNVLTTTRTEINLSNSFSQQITAIEYKTTSVGKSLFLQIQLNKIKEYPFEDVLAQLQIKNQGKIVKMLEQKLVNVNGINSRSIVWEIPDIIGATAVMFIDHFIWSPDNIALAAAIKDTKVVINDTGSTVITRPKKAGGGGLLDVLPWALTSLLLIKRGLRK